ncbi:MAG: FAD-dependent oxidoreductase, partial [Vampirovibrionales bacterium]|nr:FAD-dependent oxidoreductase [Vampirovibrionales bacterium]
YRLHQALGDKVALTILEQHETLGGHTCTVDIQDASGRTLAIDTGFMVFNKKTYPNLLTFLEALKIPYQKADMSFSLQHRGLKVLGSSLEWNGAGLFKIFSQVRNLFNIRFWRMLMALNRFNQQAKVEGAKAENSSSDCDHLTVGEYVQQQGFGDDFLTLFLLPISAAIWSMSPKDILNFPVRTLMRFFFNHGFLGINDHYQWYTIRGGARQYIEALRGHLGEKTHWLTRTPVRKISRTISGCLLTLANGEQHVFDHAILATHADQALAMLDNPTELETRLLSAFKYEANEAILHTDASVMPRRKFCWASWNYRLDADDDMKASECQTSSTHYWVSHLQSLKSKTPIFVSINGGHLIDAAKRLKTLSFTHPIFTVPAIEAQAHLPKINRQEPRQTVYFCGSYFKYGFHEDAFTAGLHAAESLMHHLGHYASK